MKSLLRKILIAIGVQKCYRSFFAYRKKQMFDPGLGGVFLNPFYFARKGLNRHMRLLAPRLRGKVLDVGCGTKPYKHFLTCENYTGLEMDTPANRNTGHADVFYDGGRFPFNERVFSSILCNEVLEHVFNPKDFIKEMNRVLKKKGLLLLTAPFVWDEHEQPNDYARYSSFGLAHLLSQNGFHIIEHCKSTPTVAVIFQMLNCYIYKKTVAKSVYMNIATTFFLMAPVTIVGLLFEKLLPTNVDLYLDNVILAEKEHDL